MTRRLKTITQQNGYDLRDKEANINKFIIWCKNTTEPMKKSELLCF